MHTKLIEQKIDALPAAYRTVFVLCALEALLEREVGELLGVSEARVRACHAEARRLLGAQAVIDHEALRREAFAFDGERCERIVIAVMSRLAHR